MSLAYYAAIGAALFPIPAGQKNPIGIIASFAKDCSSDRDIWNRWLRDNPGCNWGVVAGPSGWIIVDIDHGLEGWAAWCVLCAEWGFSKPFAPHVQSARGGWHVYFMVPDDVDARSLRQPDAIKGLINIRAGNGFVVCAGSRFGDLPYLLFDSNRMPYPAPTKLIEHCIRKIDLTRTTAGIVTQGTHDPGDMAALIQWFAERSAFVSYEDWISIGMAIRLEFGEIGRDLWALTFDGTVTSDAEILHWESFATDPRFGLVTVNTWFDRAHKAGWIGHVRRIDMFGNAIEALAAAAPIPIGTPMLGATDEMIRRGISRCKEFLDATCEESSQPRTIYRGLPEILAGEPFYGPLQNCIARLIAMAEEGKKSLTKRAKAMLAFLYKINPEVCNGVVQLCNTLGASIHEKAIENAAAAFEREIQDVFKDPYAFHTDAKNLPDARNSDNVQVLLNKLELEIRFNAWMEEIQVNGGIYSVWTPLSDSTVAHLIYEAGKSGVGYYPSKNLLWDVIEAIARQNTIDPARYRLDALAKGWDGAARLDAWLHRAWHLPADAYHQSVGRNMIGGMVRRIRQPGCVHRTMAVFHGAEQRGKGWMGKIIAEALGEESWYADTIKLDEMSKELVLHLRGKCIVEHAEMAVRRGDLESIKAQITTTHDEGRPAYGRAIVRRARRHIAYGSSNSTTPLPDGENTRFLPIDANAVMDGAWLKANIDQIIGEAAALHAAGDDFAIPQELRAELIARRESARAESPLEIKMADWFAETTDTWHYITAGDLQDALIAMSWRGSNSQRGDGMRRQGFRQENAYIGNKKTKIWVRGPEALPMVVIDKGKRLVMYKDAFGRVSMRVFGELPRVGSNPPVPENLPMITKH